MGVYLFRHEGISPLRLISVAAILTIGVLAIGMHNNPGMTDRLALTKQAAKLDFSSLNTASSLRLDIWQTSLRIMHDNGLNGVGVRAFRFAYPGYADANDPFLHNGTGPAYAHQLLLEVGTETGALGLFGLLVFYVLLIRSFSGISRAQLHAALPFLLASWAWLFPLNSHTAFYSSEWSQLLWWLLAIAFASLATNKERP